jgi:nucleoside-diphosphate-sugar epimerase
VNGVVADWAQCLVAERPCSVFGDGKQIRDFVYVDDVVDALARAAGRGDGMVLNIGTGRGTRLAELHALMVATAGRLAAEAGPEPEEPQPEEPAPEEPQPDRQPDGEAAAPPPQPGAVAEGGPVPAPAPATGPNAADAGAGDSAVTDADSEPASRARAAIRRGPPLGLRQAPARAGEVGHIVLDPSRAAKALQWAPWTDLPTGIEAVLRSGAGRRR